MLSVRATERQGFCVVTLRGTSTKNFGKKKKKKSLLSGERYTKLRTPVYRYTEWPIMSKVVEGRCRSKDFLS